MVLGFARVASSGLVKFMEHWISEKTCLSVASLFSPNAALLVSKESIGIRDAALFHNQLDSTESTFAYFCCFSKVGRRKALALRNKFRKK